MAYLIESDQIVRLNHTHDESAVGHAQRHDTMVLAVIQAKPIQRFFMDILTGETFKHQGTDNREHQGHADIGSKMAILSLAHVIPRPLAKCGMRPAAHSSVTEHFNSSDKPADARCQGKVAEFLRPLAVQGRRSVLISLYTASHRARSIKRKARHDPGTLAN